jgi:hypothetical protein
MRLTIPRSITLPYGYHIKVRLVSPAQMAQVGGRDCKGLWREDSRTIYIDKTESKPEQIATFHHEVAHALKDAENWSMMEMGLEVKKSGGCEYCG